jgi:UDP-2,3-diacylglucosamine hydrolase
MNAQSAMTVTSDPLAIICGGGSLPFVVAEAAQKAGRRVVLFPVRGAADAAKVTAYTHYWVGFGQFGRFRRNAKAEGCRDVVMIGTLVRPRLVLTQVWPDLTTLILLPQFIRLYRGGDDRLLSGVAKILEKQGFRLIGAEQIAPDILMPSGFLGMRAPNERDRADIGRGMSLLRATAPFDMGQAVVVWNNRILAIEAADGTDAMLAHLAEMRRIGRIRTPDGAGVLIKAPKIGQDRRIDLPSIGPPTIEGVARAGLAGIAVTAGSVVIAEPSRLIAAADKANIFVVGIGADGAF